MVAGHSPSRQANENEGFLDSNEPIDSLEMNAIVDKSLRNEIRREKEGVSLKPQA